MLFWCFEAFLLKFTEHFYFGTKLTILQGASERVFFSTILKRGKSWGKFDLLETTFFGKTVKREKYCQILFSSPNEPNTAKQSFSGVWNIFPEIYWKLLLWVKKMISQKVSKNYSESYFSQQ